jgi:hypothetical protein
MHFSKNKPFSGCQQADKLTSPVGHVGHSLILNSSKSGNYNFSFSRTGKQKNGATIAGSAICIIQNII